VALVVPSRRGGGRPQSCYSRRRLAADEAEPDGVAGRCSLKSFVTGRLDPLQ
jgi:hypothetical protein